jgi:hypothetical protein
MKVSFGYFSVLILLLFSNDAAAQKAIRVPTGNMILADGFLSLNEWSDAKHLTTPYPLDVFFKISGDYLLIAVATPTIKDMYTDIYFDTGGLLVDFHASAKLGQREFNNRKWSDWQWWNNSGWIASTSKINSFEDKTFLPQTCREYQIKKSRFRNHSARIYMEIGHMNSDNDEKLRFPSGSNLSQKQGWLELRW